MREREREEKKKDPITQSAFIYIEARRRLWYLKNSASHLRSSSLGLSCWSFNTYCITEQKEIQAQSSENRKMEESPSQTSSMEKEDIPFQTFKMFILALKLSCYRLSLLRRWPQIFNEATQDWTVIPRPIWHRQVESPLSHFPCWSPIGVQQ